jgi:hypothetical protein
MKYRILLILAVSILCTDTAAAQFGHVIAPNGNTDPGGLIATFEQKYDWIRQGGAPVTIDGRCASACTIVTRLPREQICISRNAELVFHAAWIPGSRGEQVTDPDATWDLYAKYPKEVRAWIRKHGGLTRRLIVMNNKTLSRLYPYCDSTTVQARPTFIMWRADGENRP